MKPFFRQAWPLLAAAFFVASCGGDSPADDTSVPDVSQPAGDLECEREGFPCSLAEVPLEILERSDALGDEALAMLEAGTSMADVAVWLEEQSDVVEVQSDDQAVRYRVEGGRGFWIYGSGVFATLGSPLPPSARLDRPLPQPLAHVVGPDSPDKQALVLSPMLYELGDFDESGAVASILEGTRGYEGGVRYKYNHENAPGLVNLDAYRDWEDYDVVHLSTHGKRICDDSGCRATLVAATLEQLAPGTDEAAAKKMQQFQVKGLEIVKGQESGTIYVVLSAEFFHHEYRGGLSDTLVYISSCQIFGPQATDIADALKGTSSVFVGWTESVFASEATDASIALYTELSEGGYTVEVARDQIGGLALGTAPGPHPAPSLIVGGRSDGDDLRIRDVVWVLNPSTKEVLNPTDEVPVEGVTGDGEDDSVPYLIQIDGVKPRDADDVTVHIAIDGVEAEPELLIDHVVNGEDQWFVDGVVELERDIEEGEEVVFHAWAELHSGGESHHEVPAKLVGFSCEVGSWSANAADVAKLVTAEQANVDPKVNVSGSLVATLGADGSAAFEFGSWTVQTVTTTPSPIPGVIADLSGAVTFESQGSATGTWALTEDGRLDLSIPDFATDVTLYTSMMTGEGEVIQEASNTVEPHMARVYVLPGEPVSHQCAGNMLVIPYDGTPISWTRLNS